MADFGLLVETAQNVSIVLGAIAALSIVVRWGWKLATSIDKVLNFSVEQAVRNKEIHAHLHDHIQMEDRRDHDRDILFAELKANIREITREIRPNGGASIKDMVVHIAQANQHHDARIHELEQVVYKR